MVPGREQRGLLVVIVLTVYSSSLDFIMIDFSISFVHMVSCRLACKIVVIYLWNLKTNQQVLLILIPKYHTWLRGVVMADVY